MKSSRRVSVSELKNMPGCVLTVFPTALKIRKIDWKTPLDSEGTSQVQLDSKNPKSTFFRAHNKT